MREERVGAEEWGERQIVWVTGTPGAPHSRALFCV